MNSPIDINLKFGILDPGKYTLRLAAKDSNGGSSHYLVDFAVSNSDSSPSNIKILLGGKFREARLNNEELTIKCGTSVIIDGTITSNYSLTTVAGAIYRRGEVDSGKPVQKYSVKSVNSTLYSLKGSPIDNNLKFGELTPGQYTLRLAANDSNSGSSRYCVNFTVKN